MQGCWKSFRVGGAGKQANDVILNVFIHVDGSLNYKADISQQDTAIVGHLYVFQCNYTFSHMQKFVPKINDTCRLPLLPSLFIRILSVVVGA